MIDNIKDLKDIYDVVKSAIDRCKEPKQELFTLDAFLKALKTDPSLLKEKVDKDYRRFFYDDFTQGLLKRLIREKSNDEKYLEVIGSIFEDYLHIFIQSLKDGVFSSAYIESMKALFEFDNLLHSYHYQISEEQIKTIRLQGQKWRDDIKEGYLLDALQDENSRCTGWSQAKIIVFSGELIKIQFLKEGIDRIMEKNSLDLAPFETKTKSTFEWKNELKVGDLVDAFDKTIWNKSTILDIQEVQLSEERTTKSVYIAYRYYCEKGSRNDEKGNYEGYSNKYDEWVTLYSPRIHPINTKTARTSYYDDYNEIDDDFDTQFPCESGHSRVFAVPRSKKCTSHLFLHLMNEFGNLGGFDLINEVIQKISENCQTQEELHAICTLIEMVSKPYLIYHKHFQKDYFPKLIQLAKLSIRNAPDKFIRDINRDKVDVIIRSIDNMQRRILTKDEREKETEILKLEMAHSCLKSSYLERKIQGMKDLNQLIKNNRVMSSKTISNEFLVKWLKENDVFPLLTDPKKTHVQIVQRLNDIMKLLLQEEELTLSFFEMFWNLSRTDYKLEVYKILIDAAIFLKKEHFDFVLTQLIGSTSFGSDKVSMDDYSCLNDLTKYAKDESFKANVNKFFWDIILKSDQVKNSQLIVCGINFIRTNKIQIYRAPPVAVQSEERAETDNQQIDTGSSPQVKQEGSPSDNMEHTIIQSIIKNLAQYCQQVTQALSSQQNAEQLVQSESRKKLFLVNHKYSHHEEIDERLAFIKYVSSSSSSFKITKQELDIIYEMLVKKSRIPSDNEEFLIWCKSLCESSSISNSILDLNEVGEFFSEKMKSKEMDVRSLPLVGFEFLQHYFLSVNEKASKILKSVPKIQKTSKFVNSYNFYNQGNSKQAKDEDDKQPIFKLITAPNNLDQLDIVWNVALQCENPKVVPKVINFLIKIHYQLDEDLDEKKCLIQDELIKKCMEILGSTSDEFTCNRVIDILKHIIYEAEKKGTGDVQPHNAVLKGELLERIQIKYRSASKKNQIVLSIYSNTTVWEFKKVVSKQFDLAPKYLKLERSSGQVLKDLDNGKTLAELGIQSYESLSAYKIFIEEEIANAPLIGNDGKLSEKAKQLFNEWFDLYSDEAGAMTKETCALFIKGCTGEHPPVNDDRIQGLFNTYDKNKDGRIEREEFLTFYETAARGKPETVRDNLKAHNVRNDLKKLSEVQEETSFKTQDMPRFKMAETQEYFDKFMELLDRQDSVSQSSWDLIQMLATNRILYTRVLQLKTAINEKTGKIDWTKFFDSQSDYRLLYTLQIVEAVMEEGEGQNMERIVVLDDSPVVPKNSQPPVVNSNAPPAPPLQGGAAAMPTPDLQKAQSQNAEKIVTQNEEQELHMQKSHSSLIEGAEYQKLKSEWTSMFLMNEGIQYIMKVFMDKEIKSGSDQQNKSFSAIFELKHIAFLLKLLRIFIMAAFSTSKESQVYQVAATIRKSSSMQEDTDSSTQKQETPAPSKPVNEGSRFLELQTLLAGPLGEEIIQQIDYNHLQQKILSVIAQLLTKKEMIFEDKLIIENALSLWVCCVVHKNELFNEFFEFKGPEQSKIKNSDQLILYGLLYNPYEKVREEFRQAFGSIPWKLSPSQRKLTNRLLKYLLQLLSSNITEISNHHSKQYFDLFCSIIESYFLIVTFEAEQEQNFNPKDLLSHIIDKIKEYNQLAFELSQKENSGCEIEEEDGQQESSELETVYIGLIQLSSKIIDNFDLHFTAQIIEEKNLIEEIFVKFLFSSVFKDGNQVKEIKIQPKKQRKTQKKQTFGKKSKDAAYKLINSLIRKTPSLMNSFMEKSMIPLMKNIRRVDQWNYQNQSSGSNESHNSEKSQKYVGLRNLGCICYMNSMLQQFFMIPAFRYNLLCVDDHTNEDLKEYKGFMVDDNMLHQLQKLMAHLELSERSDYNPFEFCFAFKEVDGNPTNTGEQKDAQEFLNLVFDRIENMLKTTSRKYLLQSVFGGQTCSQLVCKECGKVKNRIEDFFNLSLTIKDIKSMSESLSKLIEGEVINDYQCEGCGKKVDVSKRTLISQTPNVLIVHLQRITFNFDTFRNDKINTYFEFPYQLDLKPYSFYEVMKKENRIKVPKEGEEEDQEMQQQPKEEKKDEDNQYPEEEDCFEYKLVGSTVHSGTANAGHYWSLINTRRGYNEPGQDDPNWNKTENEPWMEFNDSRVSEFNFEKLKDECYGDQKTSGGGSSYESDGWSSWGSYGKSAYMLIYERKKKRPIKIVVPKEEVAEEEKQGKKIFLDEKKDENYKLIDYREGVEDIAPNKIYKQVYDDNKKYEFDNDIYSGEFFDFVKSILQTTLGLLQDYAKQKDQHSGKALMQSVNQHALFIGKKSILEILSKCYHNSQIKNLVEILIEMMKISEDLCYDFMKQCYDEDNFEYLMVVMLECPDTVARLNVCLLVKFVLTKLKLKEKDILYNVVKEEVTYISQNDQSKFTKIVETPVAMTSKFIFKCLENLNTLVAKNWTKFDNFLEVLHCFGCGDKDVFDLMGSSEEEKAEVERIGLEFLLRQQFIGKACDFLLGKKSPLATPNEKRYEMGGAYSNPNFSSIMKLISSLITKMTNDPVLSAQYPLMDFEKKLLLQHDLLKVMLGQNSGCKQFGACLASMCKDNIKYSKKVSKIFIKVINASSYDNVKSYLKALKPFLKLNDSLKTLRLEWVFGFQQILTRKEYREVNYKFGIEIISKINDEAYTYFSPIINSHSEEALLAQLLKCKGRLDTFAINCLKEMLSLMTKDDDIGKYIYKSGPATYQYARYSDWIRPYLEGQKSDLEKTNSYIYMKSKYDTIIKALSLFTIYEEKCKLFAEEEEKVMLKDKSEGKNFQGADDWWAYQNEEVIKHYPPQIVIGAQIGEDKNVMVIDDHPLATVTVIEQINDFNYSNPTGYFNLSLPHIDFRTSMYQSMSYIQYKKGQHQEQINEAKKKAKLNEVIKEEEEKINEEMENQENPQTEQPNTLSPSKEESKEESKQEEAPSEPVIKVSNWYEQKKQGSVLMKVHVANKSSDTIKYRVTLLNENDNDTNVHLPKSFMTDTLYSNEYKCIGHFQKIDPSKPWTPIKVQIEAIKRIYGSSQGFSNSRTISSTTADGFKINVQDMNGFINSEQGYAKGDAAQISCLNCKTQQDSTNFKCIECKMPLMEGKTYDPQSEHITEHFYGS